MATVIDNLGRKIDVTNMNLGEIKGLVETLMKSSVGKAKPWNGPSDKPDKKNGIDELKTLFAQFTKDFDKEVQEQKSFLSSIVESLKDLAGRREDRKKSGPVIKPPKDKEKSTMTKALNGLYQAGVVKRHSIANADIVTHEKLEEVIKALGALSGHLSGKKPTKTVATANDEGMIDNHGGRGKTPDPEDAEKTIKVLSLAQYKMNEILRTLEHVQQNMLGWNSSLGKIIDGFSKEREFTQDIRAIAYETAGVTKENRGLQKSYEQIGETTKITGMNRTESLEAYKKYLKSGIKDLKVAVSLTTTQLNTEKQLGIKAGTLGDEFNYWTQSGKMSVGQIQEMGRGLRDVARFTGLTGDELAGVVKSSKEFITSMRNAGTLTAETAKNVIEISATAKKLGVESGISPLLKAMSSSSHLLLEAGSGTQAFLLSAANSVGRTSDMINGTLLKSKAGIRDVAKGVEKVMKQYGIDDLEDLEKLSDDKKRNINLALKSQNLPELGEMQGVYKSLKEAGKTTSMRLKDIDKAMELPLNKEEKIAKLEEKRKLTAGSGLEILNALEEGAKGAKTLEEATAKLKSQKGDFAENIKGMGLDGAGSEQIIKSAIKTSLDSINEGLEKAGKKKIEVSSADMQRAAVDKEFMKVIKARLGEGEQTLARAQKKGLDPLTDISGNLDEINDNIRIIAQGWISKLFNSAVGKLAIIALTLGGIAAGILAIVAKFATIYEFMVKAKKYTSKFLPSSGKVGDVATGVAGSGTGKLRPPKSSTEIATQQARIANKKATRVTGSALDAAGNSIVAGTEKISKGIVGATTKLTEKTGAELAKGAVIGWANAVESSWKFVFGKGGAVRSTLAKWGEGLGKATEGVFSASKTVIKDGARFTKTAAVDGFKSIGKITVAGTVDVAKAGVRGATKGVGKGLGLIASTGGKAAKVLLGVGKGIPVIGQVLAVIMAGVDGLMGSMAAAERGYKIFGKESNDALTLNEEYSAKSAGLLTGILDGLTFGILGMLVPLDSWTDSLARFFAKTKIFTIIFGAIVVALEVIWGVIKGIGLAIWEILKGLWDGIMEIVNPIIDGLSNIFSAFGNALGFTESGVGGFTKTLRELGGVVGIISGPIKFVGKMIGWVFRIIGMAVGKIVKFVTAIIEGLMSAFEPLGEVLGELWEGVKEVGEGIFDIFDGIWQIIKEIVKPIADLFNDKTGAGFFDAVKDFAKWIGKNVLGNALRFVLQPLMILAKILSFVGKTIQAIVKLFSGDLSGAGDLMKSGLKGIFESLFYPLKNIFGNVGKWLWDSITSALGNFGNWLWRNTIGQLVNLGTYVYNQLISAFSSLVNWVLSKIPGGGVIQAATQSSVQNSADERVNGSRTGHGIGRIMGGNILGGIGEVGRATLSNINPFNWFEEGTTQVETPGLGVLHQGETIIPAREMKKLIAVGAGPYKPSIGTASTAGMPNMPSLEKAVAASRASNDPAKTEITSSELGEIAEEATTQTELMEEMVDLFSQFLQAIQTKEASGSSGNPGDNSTKQVIHGTPNYYRNRTGLVAQTAGKAALNMGGNF